MLVVLVFIASFIVLLIGTIMFPAIQPGQMVCDVLGNSETNYLIAGISGERLISGIINGLVWGVIIVVIYSYLKGPSKGKVNLPIWVPGYTTSDNSKIENESLKQHDKQSFLRMKKIQDIERVEGIGYKYGCKLRKIGIENVDDLLQVGYTRTGRNYLAKNIGVSPSTIRDWVYQAEARS